MSEPKIVYSLPEYLEFGDAYQETIENLIDIFDLTEEEAEAELDKYTYLDGHIEYVDEYGVSHEVMFFKYEDRIYGLHYFYDPSGGYELDDEEASPAEMYTKIYYRFK